MVPVQPSSAVVPPVQPPVSVGAQGPTVLIPRKLNPEGVVVISRPGALTPWGNERTSYRILTGDPRGWAEAAADNGLIRYVGNGLYQDNEGNRIQPEEVLPRFEAQLRQMIGPRWLAVRDGHKVDTPFGGQIPEGMRDLKAAMGMTADEVRRTSYAATWNNLLKVAQDDVLLMIYAGARMYLANGHFPDQVFPDPRTLGIDTGRGLAGVEAFIRLTEAALKGRNAVTGMVLPQILQSAAMGVWMGIIGPKGDELASGREDYFNRGARTMGPNFQGSAECATFMALACHAANRIGPPRKPGQRRIRGMQVGVGEAPHGRDDARICAVGFNSMKAMETLDALLKRHPGISRDQIDLWRAYAPFTDASGGFWPGTGGTFVEEYDLMHGVRNGLLFDAFLVGYGVFPDQGGKRNHAQLGKGVINAMEEGLRMAHEGFGITPDHLDYVNFHGTATPDTNRKEPLFLANVIMAAAQSYGVLEQLRRRKRKLKVTALKAFLTHLLGDAGGAEVSMLLQVLRYQKGPGVLNLAGRQIIVPDNIREVLDFSEEPIDGGIDVVGMLSEGFSGNNVFKMLRRATGDSGDEFLLRFGGITRDDVRVMRELQAEREEVSRDLDERIRTGRMTMAELLDWASFKDRSSTIPAPSFSMGWTSSSEAGKAELSESARELRGQLDRMTYAASNWVTIPIWAIRNALADSGESGFEAELERLNDLIPRLQQSDPSSYFPDTGLPHVIKVLISNPRALEVLADSLDVAKAIQDLVSPTKIEKISPAKIDVNAAIPLAERRLALGYPGQGSFEQKRTGVARTLYDTDPTYRSVIDEAHERLLKYNYDLKKMLFSGTEDDLIQTVHQQPVLLADEIGRDESEWQSVQAREVPVIAAFGDSLGLITAAYRAGYFESPADAVEFAYLRGQVMGNLNPFGPDARPMALIPGFNEDQIRGVVREVNDGLGVHVTVSKRNGVGKLVVSGDPEGISLLQQRLASRGANMVVIGVSTPFHDEYYFKDAAKELLQRARAAGIKANRRGRFATLIANSTGQAVSDDVDILEFLAGEIAAPVDLVTSIQTAAALGANSFFEIGPRATITSEVETALGALSQSPGPIHAAYVPTVSELEKLFG